MSVSEPHPGCDDPSGPASSPSTEAPADAPATSGEPLGLYAQAFEHCHEAIAITDARRCIVAVNRAFTTLTGHAAAAVAGQALLDRVAPRRRPELDASLCTALALNGTWQGELPGRRDDGSDCPLWLSLTEVRDATGTPQHCIAILLDISERKANEARIHYLAHFDALTGLPNRVLLHQRLARATARARRAGWKVAVLFLDLDRFKTVNDSLGHDAGDQLLTEVAGRLRRSVREEDTVARLGGDEFVIVVERLQRDMDVALIADKVLRVVGAPLTIAGHELRVSTSIGISLFPEPSADADALIRNADTAMYHAKQAGRDNFQFFSEDMNARVLARLTIENGLRHALERGEFAIYYQPQVALADARLTGLEALLRWHAADGTVVPPDRFVPIAEESGLIVPIGEWALREACRQARRWRDAGLATVPVALNLSAVQFHRAEIATVLHDALWESGLEPRHIALEVTESTLMDADVAAATLEQLHELGVALAIDDFGTGYSNLGYLKRFPIDRLKIDRSFVRDIVTDPNDAAIVCAVIRLAHTLGLRVVAEGVETVEQLDFLRRQGCDEAQGYLFSPPLPEAAVTALLQDGGFGPQAR
ncbi:PAS domain S-box-containing protein/diguanylate cyclase (GGDEF)-like protein [Plasticicumulans lactativorans]|uniref:cyclic-guanylate-specific phosphodiesterase n=1 Tax=Plasticicumulans lactativorans TaxID=1133106 RepID=A0A4R2L3H1_9GAMM|nr:EAL domain-containing protein [Plasticicumulans lactativorans]TCO80923.1 PAS domain S-box-containing protein/diguanylate cyclase (GGDEF)-like protein [Plasticicumulans lactativorans]